MSSTRRQLKRSAVAGIHEGGQVCRGSGERVSGACRTSGEETNRCSGDVGGDEGHDGKAVDGARVSLEDLGDDLQAFPVEVDEPETIVEVKRR